MHVDAILAFLWIWWYEEFRSFFPIRVVFMAIWLSWLWSCGIYWGGRTCRILVGVCLSRRGYLPIGLMVLGRISHGLRASLYKDPHFNWLKTDILTVAVWIPCCGYRGLSQWWELGPNRDPPPFPFIFLKLWYWCLPWLVCGFNVGSYQLGLNSWLPPILVTDGIGDLFGLCPLFCLYPHGYGIGWNYRWVPVTLSHNPGGFPAGIPSPRPSFRWRCTGCCCCVMLPLVYILSRTLGE